ncbi:potassium channel family protein [Halpernia sp.]|uniref:potassium channel family protein n=1 Tax=Halpernia sp. TaxID=2782209 RepID=UPI003A94296C
MIITIFSSFLHKKRYRYLFYTTLIVLIIGVVGFHYLEDWRWIDSLNYAVSTMVTTGNAGVIPKTDIGKIFNVFYMLTSVILILFFIDTIHQYFYEWHHSSEIRQKRRRKQLKKHFDNSSNK